MKSRHKINVYWTILPNINKPKSIFQDPVRPNPNAQCPVVADYCQRTRILNSPYHLEIKPNWIYEHKLKGYKFEGFDFSSNDVRPEHIWNDSGVIDTGNEMWYDPLNAQFQYIMPYVFICEEPINMSLVGLQKNENKSQLDDLLYIEAVLEISKMARALSSAWAFQSFKNVKATFLKGQPHMKLLFSEPVRLHKFTSTPLFEKWLSENSGLVHHQRGTKRVFDVISKRRPKKMFDEIKDNIEYSET